LSTIPDLVYDGASVEEDDDSSAGGPISALSAPPRTGIAGDAASFRGSPEWWVRRLEAKLSARASDISRFEQYYEGRHRLAFATSQFRTAFGTQFRAFSDNFMQTVVDAVDERLEVEGFRIPVDTGDAGEDALALLKGDTEAWEIWQANQLDSTSQLIHTDALVDGVSYAIVGPGEEHPEITGESALQVICETAPGYHRRRLAALKKWQDEDGFMYATLFLPAAVYKYVSAQKVTSTVDQIRWTRRRVEGEDWPLLNPIGIVPVVAFCNRRRLVRDGMSEIAQLLPLQDGINKLFMDMLIASEYAGFPQRYATGIEAKEDPETHQQVDFLKLALDRFLHVEDPDAKFGTLTAAELSNYTTAIAMAIQHLATRSSTPPHYFLANMGNFPSGEALKAAETGLVSKVRRRMKHFGEDWEEVIRLAFLMDGKQDKARAALSAETIWGDPESRSESEHIDAILKLSALGVPAEVLWEKSGMFSPQEIARMKELVKANAPVITPTTTPNTTQGGMGPSAGDAAMA
jgi:hypothetical protein